MRKHSSLLLLVAAVVMLAITRAQADAYRYQGHQGEAATLRLVVNQHAALLDALVHDMAIAATSTTNGMATIDSAAAHTLR